MIHITASGEQAIAGQVKKIVLNVNNALTGTITVSDGVGNVVAVITNPTVGSSFQMGRFLNDVRINPSAICDLTVSIDGSNGGF